MAEIQHPAFANVMETIPDDRLADWLAAGWLDRSAEIDNQGPPEPDEATPARRR